MELDGYIFDDNVVNGEGIKALATLGGLEIDVNRHGDDDNDNDMEIDDNISITTIDTNGLPYTNDQSFPIGIFHDDYIDESCLYEIIQIFGENNDTQNVESMLITEPSTEAVTTIAKNGTAPDETIIHQAAQSQTITIDEPPTNLITTTTKLKRKIPVLSEEAIARQHPEGPRKKVEVLGACESHKHLDKKKIVGMNCNSCKRKCKPCIISKCPCIEKGKLWFTTQSDTNEKVYLHQDIGDDEVRVVHLKWKNCHELVQERRDILKRRQTKNGIKKNNQRS